MSETGNNYATAGANNYPGTAMLPGFDGSSLPANYTEAKLLSGKYGSALPETGNHYTAASTNHNAGSKMLSRFH